jgi:hypothetical protein
MSGSVRTIGVFNEVKTHLGVVERHVDLFWNQCEEPLGVHRGFAFRRWERDAEFVAIHNWPSPPGGARKILGWKRHLYRVLRTPQSELRIEAAYRWLGRDRARTVAMLYEPPPMISDRWMEISRVFNGRVYAPDPRASHPCVLPSMWTLAHDVHTLRRLSPPEKPLLMSAINSGKSAIPGHGARTEFFAKLRRAGVPMELFGLGLPESLGGRGVIQCKSTALLPARFALVIENYGEGDLYVSEKLWDALLCWCLPIYFGPRAADRVIPSESFVRIDDLGERGVAQVREAIADVSLWEKRLEAIAEARRRCLGELRWVEWAAKVAEELQ